MEERNCKECVFDTREGCCHWDCEFIPRNEAVKAYREKLKEKE